MRPGDLVARKQAGRPILMLTAWDALSGALVEEAGAEVVLVGDSLAMVVLGHATTLPVTLAEMIGHTQAVARGLRRPRGQQPLLICDLPFLSYQCGTDQAVAAAGRVLKESAAAAVKLEGGEPETVAVIDRLVRSGIPVMGHLGLTPQSVHRLGYRRQARDPISQERLRRQALDLEAAGCFALVLEHVPADLAGSLRRQLAIPVIGIGAGDDCDGQVRVTADLLGLTPSQPPFSAPLLAGRELCVDALRGWLQSATAPEAPLEVDGRPTRPATPSAPHC
ncbi:3-methyl-2-oxobutanoate hydroxymethyltransferase [Synechococcus sp. Cruz-9H2]|nr:MULTISPECIES: 3-methyl-2-oxobutanoate hydroxymethyltransferase [unclassified Synechococcus]MCP9818769.1 3-methyl-2-oxobutanoate hydroxymethyltransferase [Synechococcus sp. Cruz-9H2]MCP9842999.1 3-methyl-2-oxobutanoate hydroxymethyltransferase [Synechococcus sp. Edmonson 11F2]MCP9856024.1 3-methyl-2-oxobutanoate hydroxymethyltransferase [Synechococcus sp. Cruz-9C9]MCP9862089.1 3-methyl-2-oxobutanoate hydroxymethyltransferase [Synechococcus sp. Cruz-7E5]MCP9869360.1 3-methyl-2-oxobutanoate hy